MWRKNIFATKLPKNNHNTWSFIALLLFAAKRIQRIYKLLVSKRCPLLASACLWFVYIIDLNRIWPNLMSQLWAQTVSWWWWWQRSDLSRRELVTGRRELSVAARIPMRFQRTVCRQLGVTCPLPSSTIETTGHPPQVRASASKRYLADDVARRGTRSRIRALLIYWLAQKAQFVGNDKLKLRFSPGKIVKLHELHRDLTVRWMFFVLLMTTLLRNSRGKFM